MLDALGWRRPLVVGHSLGGYVGAYLAARYPERVGALVIADTVTQWSDDEAAWAQRQVDRPGPEFANASEAGSRYRLSPSETRAPWSRAATVDNASPPRTDSRIPDLGARPA